MAGKFEVFLDSDSYFRFRLKAPDGTVVAVSGAFEDKASVAAGIAAVRECAGTGLVTDLCPAAMAAPIAPSPAAVLVPAQLQPNCGDQCVPATRAHPFVIDTTSRRRVTAPRWT
ncbi:YegP family protein [Pseudarthrobacter sp. Y6]|uniref:YegP family protein n=1 Tax=Pseudarthrobacter sp. Y6 TaxID=3418422 RepID=UPI003CF498CD